MQTTISKYAEDNNLKFHPMKYLMAGGQIISRGFKEKLLSVFKGRFWVSQITIEEKSICRRNERLAESPVDYMFSHAFRSILPFSFDN